MNVRLKNTLIWGGGMGLLMVGIVALSIMGEESGLDYFVAEIIGYATMFLGLGIGVFFVLRKERAEGELSFLRGFGMGMGVSSVAGFVFGVYTLLLIGVISPDLPEILQDRMLDSMREDGALPEKIAEVQAQMAAQPEWVSQPLFQGALMMVTVILVGVVVSLILAALMRKKASS